MLPAVRPEPAQVRRRHLPRGRPGCSMRGVPPERPDLRRGIQLENVPNLRVPATVGNQVRNRRRRRR